jgi:hypothetical protein
MYDPEERRPWRRRKYQVAAAGVTATLGAAALAGYLLLQHDTETPPNVSTGLADRPSEPHPSAAASSGAPPAPTSASASPAATASAAATVSAAVPTRSPAGKPPVPTKRAATAPAVPVQVSASGSLAKDRRYIRVYSARGDASGEREMQWVADEGHPVGSARCTQTFKVNAQDTPRERPTMVLCWRITAAKSVYVISVDIEKRPSDQAAVAALDRAWHAMG